VTKRASFRDLCQSGNLEWRHASKKTHSISGLASILLSSQTESRWNCGIFMYPSSVVVNRVVYFLL
jgi:hypothetical protein